MRKHQLFWEKTSKFRKKRVFGTFFDVFFTFLAFFSCFFHFFRGKRGGAGGEKTSTVLGSGNEKKVKKSEKK